MLLDHERQDAGQHDPAEVEAELDGAAAGLVPVAVGDARGDVRGRGDVVTEMRTPTSAPDLAEVNESMPAMPARNATMNDSESGW